jgi:WD40 repeat protein
MKNMIIIRNFKNYLGILVCFLILGSAFRVGGMNSIPQNDVPNDLKPKLVVQLGHSLPTALSLFSHDGKYLISSGIDGKIIVWDVSTGRELWNFKNKIGFSGALEFIPKTHQLLVGSMDGSLKLWDIETGEEIYTYFTDNMDTFISLAVSKDGHYAITYNLSGFLTYWDLKNRKRINHFFIKTKKFDHPLMTFMNQIYVRLAFSPEGNYAVVGTSDNSLEIWDLKRGIKTKSFHDSFNPANAFQFSEDGKTLLLIDFKGIKGKFPLEDEPCFTLYGESDPVKILERYVAKLLSRYNAIGSFDEYSKELAFCYLEKYPHLISKFKISQEVKTKYPEMMILILSSKSMNDKEREYWLNIITKMNSSQISELFKIIYKEMRYLIEQEKEVDKTYIFNPRELPDHIEYTIFSPDKKVILNVLKGGGWEVFDRVSKRKSIILPIFNEEITPVNFSLKNKHIVGYTLSGGLVMINLENGEIVRRFERQSLPVQMIFFSEDDSHVLVGMKESQAIEKFAALTSKNVLLKDIKDSFVEKKPWLALWDIKNGRQLDFKEIEEPYKWDNDWAAKKEIISKLKPKDPFKDIYNDFLQKKYGNQFNEFVAQNKPFLYSIKEKYRKLEHASDLWEKGESFEAMRILKEVFQVILTPEEKASFDDVEIKFEQVKTFFSMLYSMFGAINVSQGAVSKDNLKIGFTEETEIKLLNLKHFFSFLLEAATAEDFKDKNKAISLSFKAFQSALKTLKGHKQNVLCLVFSPDSDILLSVDEIGECKLWNAETGDLIDSREVKVNGKISRVLFSSDGNKLALLVDNGFFIGLDKNTKEKLFKFKVPMNYLDGVACFNISRNNMLLIFGYLSGKCTLFDYEKGKELCSIFSFINGTWVVVDPEGRFDTNDLEEVVGLHWIMPNKKMRPFPLEIFMKKYYEPKLLARIRNKEQFIKIPPLTSLNLDQPEVKIIDIKPNPNNPGMVSVSVELGMGESEFEKNRKTTETKVYDLWLFRDRQLVGYKSKTNEVIKLDPKSDKQIITFENIKLPRKRDIKEVLFSAYAFNENEVKSKTSWMPFNIPRELKPRKGRAYIISFGVNSYESPVWNLNYAVDDAKLISNLLTEKLKIAGEYDEIVPILLISNKSDHTATKKNVNAVLDLLSGKKIDFSSLKGVLNIEKIKPANPEDFILLFFSCHGFDKDGAYYFMPFDIGKGHDKTRDVPFKMLKNCISSKELSLWLRDVDAGDMVMIIDACYSEAAVKQKGFKPGPMGSKDLGQLSYNKGMKILASSEKDSLECKVIKHGILTYALVQDGIEAKKADYKPKDKSITLSEWLGYGLNRVPELYRKIIMKCVDPRRTEIDINYLQQPALFDFTKKEYDIILFSL